MGCVLLSKHWQFMARKIISAPVICSND